MLHARQNDGPAEDGDDEDAFNRDNEEFVKSLDDQPAEDLDDIAEAQGTDRVDGGIDETCGGGVDATDIPYEIAVRTFMEQILENSLSTARLLKDDPLSCDLCLEDDTIDQKLKASLTRPYILLTELPLMSTQDKRYTETGKLQLHKDSGIHAPRARWIRQAKINAEKTPGPVRCPYCAKLGRDKSFVDVRGLTDHIEHLTSGSKSLGNLGPEHDELKRLDGWYDPGWANKPDPSSTSVRMRGDCYFAHVGRTVKELGVRYSDAPEDREMAAGIPHPSLAGVFLGGGHKSEIPDQRKGLVEFADPPTVAECPSSLLGQAGSIIPDKFKDFIEFDDSFEPMPF